MIFCFLALLVNWVLAVFLFFVNGFVGSLLTKYNLFDYDPLFYENSDSSSGNLGIANFAMRVVHPIIFMAIVATVLQGLLQSAALPWIKTLWLLSPLYWLVQYLYAKFRNRTELHVKHVERFNFILSFVFFEVIFLLVILLASEDGKSTVPSIFIPLDELRNAVWYAILAFIVTEIWEIFKYHYIQSREIVNEQIESVLKNRYYSLFSKYSDIVERCIRDIFYIKDDELKKAISYLIFSIMIYEDYNRSECVRKIENLRLKFFKKEMSVGVMQVRSDIQLSDEQSIEKACELLKPNMEEVISELYEESRMPHSSSMLWSFDSKIARLLKKYNAKQMYTEQVRSLFCAIRGWESAKEVASSRNV